MQSKIQSFYEQLCNIGSGFVISLAYWQFVVVPYLKYLEDRYEVFYTNPSVALTVTIQFTIISITRSYFWRRFNNYLYMQRLWYYS